MKLTRAQILSNWQWMLSSPMLLNLNNNLDWATLQPDKHAWVNDHEKIIHYVLNRPHQRLGIQFEHLLACALHRCTQITDLQRNVQIASQQQKTLGELDFLCRLNSQHSTDWCHIESAVKFYLADCASPDALIHMSSWIGPNRKDRLDLKVERLLGHQLRLTEKDACQNQLGLAGKRVHQRLFVKGRLYLPRQWRRLGEVTLRQHLPPQINTHAELGWWSTLNDFKQELLCSAEHDNAIGCIMDRHAWLGLPAFWSPAHSGSNGQRTHKPNPPPFKQHIINLSDDPSDALKLHWLTTLENLIHEVQRPVQIMLYTQVAETPQTPNRAQSRPLSPQRLFITPNHWPQKTRPLRTA